MTTLSTHDTKRSDDVRARLLVLCEDPDAFTEFASKLLFDTRDLRSEIIDGATQWFFYQTLVGAWPIDAVRLKAYMQKAMREAKVRTSWTNNNAEYETAVNDWIDALLNDPESIEDIERYVATIKEAGQINSLSQTLLKYTAPGVPDMYQGGELWDLSLVDPDNRRPVDYARRAKLLEEISTMSVGAVMARADEGLPKLWVVHHALRLRQEHPAWFGAEAAYTPVPAIGVASERVIASLRAESVMTVAQRFPQHGVAWGETMVRIPQGRWRSVLCGCEVDGGDVPVSALLNAFPVALLVRS
jgi:(1->4)-alpha-D-glucan 1-alpha-D-glucosylmutase